MFRLAYWEEDDSRPGTDAGTGLDLEPEDIYSCDYGIDELFEESDVNGDGLFNTDEFQRTSPPEDVAFSDVDINDDGMIEYKEVVAYVCTCDNELETLADQLPYKTSVEFFESLGL